MVDQAIRCQRQGPDTAHRLTRTNGLSTSSAFRTGAAEGVPPHSRLSCSSWCSMLGADILPFDGKFDEDVMLRNWGSENIS